MKAFESHWQNQEGIAFHLRGWAPETGTKAVVALVHGFGEHTGRYANVAQALTRAGYALIGFDLRGHGQSGGPRGHAPSYEVLMDDIAAFLRQIRPRYPRLPVFLYGHSLGGNLVLNFALRRKAKLRGVIASSPWLRVAFEPPAWKVALARVTDRLAPGFSQAAGLESAALSHDARVVAAYDSDPLVHDRISVRLFLAARASGLWALEHAAGLRHSLLLMHGTADRDTSCEASRLFAQRAGKRATWRAWSGWYHELHNEPGQARVFAAMIKWMDSVRRHRPA
jgi:alpha-beta hydrolase superfamily lysophospholipase